MPLAECDCVAGVPPFGRFIFIYEALRVRAGDDTLPSVECVRGLSFQDQVTAIYEAARAYAGDDSLPEAICLRGTPMWEQWKFIYAAIYVAAGEPDSLPLPECVSGPFAGLSETYCALFLIAENGPSPGPTLLGSYDIGDPYNIEGFVRPAIAGYTGIDGDPFAQMAGVNVLRSAHYVDGEPTVLLEDVPTPPAGGLSVTDNFDTYGDFVLLENQVNWDSIKNSMMVINPGGSGYVRGNTNNAVSIVSYVADDFQPNAISEVTLDFVNINASGVSCRGDIGTQSAYFAYSDSVNIWIGRMVGGVDGGYVSTTPPLPVGGKLRMWATGTGAATRVNVEKDIGSGWVAVFTNVDMGVYLDGTLLGLSSFSDTGATSHISTWSGYDQ